jgi:hypothetical protein
MPNKKRDMDKYWFKRGKEDKMECKRCHCHHAHGCGVYFLGFIGAAVYYIQQSSTFWQGVVGVLKALVWPAFLVYRLLLKF